MIATKISAWCAGLALLSAVILMPGAASAKTWVNAGPIWNNDHAKARCPVVAKRAGGQWSGHWRTTVQGVMSVCEVLHKVKVNAGPIWSNADAQKKCPVAAAAVGGKWTGQWVTTAQGKMSVCEVLK